ncbi:MAG TPA: hypothetical protein VH063_19570 [Gaiellaceae bacterium]|nr:hypothetical protein [Gaiellaceae bacterium]
MERWIGLACLVGALCVLPPGRAHAAAMPNHHQMVALYVIDHLGQTPRNEAALVPYSVPFQKILSGCHIGVDDLTNLMTQMSYKAGEVGARYVTNLQALKSVARRITWVKPRACGMIYDRAEAYLEDGLG